MARRGMLSGLTERTAENHKSVARNVRNVRIVLLLVNLCSSRFSTFRTNVPFPRYSLQLLGDSSISISDPALLFKYIKLRYE